MKNSPFYAQAELLLRILPIIKREEVFALKGGTVINFFIRELPRLSVDIDLVYLPVNERSEALSEISKYLIHIEENILRLIPKSVIQRRIINDNISGLIITRENAAVKIEPNIVIRGSVFEPVEYDLCNKAKDIFEISVKIKSLTFEELYAGKICAALDRQHPRDLFDIKLLLEDEGISEKTRKAFIVYLISHNRPMIELLDPGFQDISNVYSREFIGLTEHEISLDELLSVRLKLIKQLQKGLTIEEKKFLISFKQMTPQWDLLGLKNIERLPAVNWKLNNLQRMSKEKHNEALNKLLDFLKTL